MLFSGGSSVLAVLAVFGISPRREPPPVRQYPKLAFDAEIIEPNDPELPDSSPDDVSDVSDRTVDVSGRTIDLSDERKKRRRKASTRQFTIWLARLDDVPAEITQRVLLSLYAEYCEVHDKRPLTDRTLLNCLKEHGVSTRRPSAKIVNGKQHRPTMYRIKPAPEPVEQRRAA